MNVLADHIRRLAEIDRLLATTGVVAPHVAEDFGVNARTVRRDLDLLRDLSGARFRYALEPRGARRYYYVDRRRRVFSSAFAGE